MIMIRAYESVTIGIRRVRRKREIFREYIELPRENSNITLQNSQHSQKRVKRSRISMFPCNNTFSNHVELECNGDDDTITQMRMLKFHLEPKVKHLE